MKVGGICGDCGKYYSGDSCGNYACGHVSSGKTMNFIPDIPEHFNRGLGIVVKNRQHYREEIKERGLIEVGNERNYISPEANDKLQEKKESKLFGDVRQQALAMMADKRWN